jgi:N-acyl homoserine lactone hydrolase
MTEIRRLGMGYFVRPGGETPDGAPRVEPLFAYLLRHDHGVLLFDSGIGSGYAEVDAHYRPTRRDLPTALAGAGVNVSDVGIVANCHLHFDHCGGNPRFVGVPIVAQRVEMAAARTESYTFPELIDFSGARYEEVDGEAEIWPGVWVIPTPGHVDGHQSLVVEKPDGTVVLAGQAHDFATQFGADQMARRAGLDGVEQPLPAYAPWLDRLADFDPRRVLFAHDAAVWEP